MVKYNVIAPIRQLLLSGLDRILQNLIHTCHIGTHGNHRRQILQRPLHGIIQSGGYQQKQKQRQHIYAAIHQKHRTGQRHSGNTKLQYHSCRCDKYGVRQLRINGLSLYCTDFPCKPVKVSMLCIAGLQITDRLDVLLNPVRACHIHRHIFRLHPILQLIASQHNCNRYRNYPQSRQRHAPVKSKKTDCDQHGGDQ